MSISWSEILRKKGLKMKKLWEVMRGLEVCHSQKEEGERQFYIGLEYTDSNVQGMSPLSQINTHERFVVIQVLQQCVTNITGS